MLVAIYGVAVGAVTVAVFPKQRGIVSSWAWDILGTLADDIKRQRPNQTGGRWELNENHFKEKSDEAIVRELTDAARDMNLADPDKKDLAVYREGILSIERKYRERLDALPMEQLKAVGIAFAAWLVPALLVYVFGYGVGWIYRGFAQKGP